ncbi:MAG TPA: Cj0069 family protein [Caulobacteraceae bacterium]|jgi:hypothetical protein
MDAPIRADPDPTIAIVWRGEPGPLPPRLEPIAAALEALGASAAPVAFAEETAEAVREQLLACHGALVWVDPLTDGLDRARLDAVLRHVASRGVWVSAHPDVIVKMGVKEVLVRTRDLGWGADTHAYAGAEDFRREFPVRLATDGVRVLKQNRGNGAQGVWKVELSGKGAAVSPDTPVTVLEARSDMAESGLPLGDFMARCETYFAGSGRLIDQAFQPRVGEGMIRCYMGQDRVLGFSRQAPRAQGREDLPIFGMARDKTFYPKSEPSLRALRRSMDDEWTPGLQSLLDIAREDLPVLWDADFLLGPRNSGGADTYVLCEINVSCVTPYPVDEAPAIARAAVEHATGSRRTS